MYKAPRGSLLILAHSQASCQATQKLQWRPATGCVGSIAKTLKTLRRKRSEGIVVTRHKPQLSEAEKKTCAPVEQCDGAQISLDRQQAEPIAPQMSGRFLGCSWQKHSANPPLMVASKVALMAAYPTALGPAKKMLPEHKLTPCPGKYGCEYEYKHDTPVR